MNTVPSRSHTSTSAPGSEYRVARLPSTSTRCRPRHRVRVEVAALLEHRHGEQAVAVESSMPFGWGVVADEHVARRRARLSYPSGTDLSRNRLRALARGGRGRATVSEERQRPLPPSVGRAPRGQEQVGSASIYSFCGGPVALRVASTIGSDVRRSGPGLRRRGSSGDRARARSRGRAPRRSTSPTPEVGAVPCRPPGPARLHLDRTVVAGDGEVGVSFLPGRAMRPLRRRRTPSRVARPHLEDESAAASETRLGAATAGRRRQREAHTA